MEASLTTVQGRDSKGLYRDAKSGKVRDVVGIDVPFHPPTSPDIVINTDGTAKPKYHALQLARSIPQFLSALDIGDTQQDLNQAEVEL